MKYFADLHEAADYVEHRSERILHKSEQVLEQARELLAKTDVVRMRSKTYFLEHAAKRL